MPLVIQRRAAPRIDGVWLASGYLHWRFPIEYQHGNNLGASPKFGDFEIHSPYRSASARSPFRRPVFSGTASRTIALPLVRPDFQATRDRRIDPEVLLDGTSESVLDRSASLDHASDRDGPPIGRLPEGCSDERTRCQNALWTSRRTSPREMSLLTIGANADGSGRTRVRLNSRRARSVTSLAGLVPVTLSHAVALL